MSRPKVLRNAQSAWPLWFRALGSVWCAAFLLGALAVILMASTTIESRLGTPHAQRLVYQTRWFDAFLALLGLNIAASTVLRWPFKRKHTGFIITHIGILLLLAGSLLSRLAGVEGQMLLYEGESSGRIAASRFEIVAGHGREAGRSYPLEALKKGMVLTTLEDGSEIVYSDFRPNAVLETSVEDGGPDPNPAIRVKLASQMAGFSQPFWLVLRDPADPDSARKMLGPAVLELKPDGPPADAAPGGGSGKTPKIVFHRGGQTVAEVPLQPLPDKPVDVGSTGHRLQNVRYWPDARVGDDNKLTSVSDKPLNPAFEAELVSPAGDVVRLVRFTNFPDFESMHPKPGTPRPDFDVDLVAGEGAANPPMPVLSFYAAKPWQFRFRSMKGGASGSPIEEGKTYPAGWMDFEFTVERLVDRAIVRRAVREISGPKGLPAVLLQVRKDGQPAADAWILPDSPAHGPDGRPLPVRMRQSAVSVPFALRLNDFRKVDYPGTTRPASFESDVTLEDPAEGFSLSRTIKMNKPLDYKGFRIFQSSYIEDPDHGEASVFTVAKNPGIPLIYAGTVILFLGAFVTFFIPPLSSLSIGKN